MGGAATVLCVGLRGIKEGFNRESTSFNGRAMGSESYSSPVRNSVGAAVRNSPKVILTAPKASCGKTFLTGTEIVACCRSTPPSIHLDRRSAGSRSRIGSNGISNSETLCDCAPTCPCGCACAPAYGNGSGIACSRGSPGTDCNSETAPATAAGFGAEPGMCWRCSGCAGCGSA